MFKLEIRNVLFALGLAPIAYMIHGAILIEEFNDLVDIEIARFVKKSDSHDAAYNTLKFCRKNNIDYTGCKIEIQRRFSELGLTIPVDNILLEIESLHESLTQEKESLFAENSSAAMAATFYWN